VVLFVPKQPALTCPAKILKQGRRFATNCHTGLFDVMLTDQPTCLYLYNSTNDVSDCCKACSCVLPSWVVVVPAC
jgi:hypothetical protein